MSRYTLKTFYGTKLLEGFEHRNVAKLRSVLEHPRHHRNGQPKVWDDTTEYANRFELYDSHLENIFAGNVNDALAFLKTLR